MMNSKRYPILAIFFLIGMIHVARADDWPQWGHDSSRNMVSPDKGIPHDFRVGKFEEDSESVDLSTTFNVNWTAKLGSQSYGNVTVSKGMVFVGTNNESPRDSNHRGDRGILMCFDERTGAFQWQLVVPKLGEDDMSDLGYLGICSSPTVDEDHVYAVTNRCEAICLDIHGLANGNNGPFTNESEYIAGAVNPPMKVGKTSADILWYYDMRKELNVVPHNISSSSILVVGDRLYVTTSNGIDWKHQNIPSPFAPCLIVLDKHSGKLLGVENSGISQRLMHCNWSSPAYGEINGKGIIFFGAGDGYCYGFDPCPAPNGKGQHVLKELWRFNCVPEEYKNNKYSSPEGPSEIIATPVFYNNKIYLSIGQDPEHGDGSGQLACIDASKKGNITKNGAVWTYKNITRSISTASIVDGLLFIADFAGFVHCLDAETGKVYWIHDTKSHIWGSTIAVDGKIFVGNEDGYLTVLSVDKEKKLLNEIDMGASMYSSPVAANGMLFLTTDTHLYAIQNSSDQIN